MKPEVETLLKLGPFPPESASAAKIARHEAALRAISRPLALEEANALAKLFGPDGCYGMAWTLLHLIESCPEWPEGGQLPDGENAWVERLRRGIKRAV